MAYGTRMTHIEFEAPLQQQGDLCVGHKVWNRPRHTVVAHVKGQMRRKIAKGYMERSVNRARDIEHASASKIS